ncbi:MAG: hypothetical protein IV089_09890 [Thiobacillus sp.]|nr:hypothetical protein [Thiobacillus sp.]
MAVFVDAAAFAALGRAVGLVAGGLALAAALVADVADSVSMGLLVSVTTVNLLFYINGIFSLYG